MNNPANLATQVVDKLMAIAASATVKLTKRCAPAFEPSKWNDYNGIQYSNNCYNYACDIETGTFAQPGKASGNPFAHLLDCSEVHNSAISDGLVQVDCDSDCEGSGCMTKACCHKVALVIAPGTGWNCDFHWYRLDENGQWSHKPGQSEVTNLDDSGNIIMDPRTADRGPYTEFCTCYCVCKKKVEIE